MSHRLPLLSRQSLDDTFAWRESGPVTVRRFLADAHALAATLPEGQWLLNVCGDRYHFAVGFVAGLLTGKTSLQPSSQSLETLSRIAAQYPGTCCLRDDDFDAGTLPHVDFPALDNTFADTDYGIPDIEAERIVAVMFTSGSTGEPQPQAKTWGKLVANAQAGAKRLDLLQHPMNIVATVPAQHSYGFESSFLPALHGNSPFWAGKPFYPQDIATALASVPEPRLLVTTPFHLSTLLETDLPLPGIDRLLSATAPLSHECAAQAEARYDAPVLEIYGSTESGQLASRRTTLGAPWTLLDGTALKQQGDAIIAYGGHVEGEVPLGDLISLQPDGRFVLEGRHADMVNIAGRRTSLAWLNHQLHEILGVRDGSFFLPDETADRHVTRLAAFVVAPGLDRKQLMAELRRRMDPVFLPRPLVFCDELPRNATGKLTRDTLQALHDRWKENV